MLKELKKTNTKRVEENKELENYFEMSGIRTIDRLNKTPFIVLDPVKKGTVNINIVENTKELLELADSTQVIGQWQQDWETKYYLFTVGDLRGFLKQNPRKSHQKV